MKAADGKTMTIGISVDGASIAAYACNGTDDEAWFFGNQTDGKIDIKSRFRDTLRAEFTGTDVAGDLTMNGVAYKFTAAPVSGAAGMYTADRGRRASVVGPSVTDGSPSACSSVRRPARSSSSRMFNSSPTTSSAPRSATRESFSRPGNSRSGPTGP